MPRPVLGRRVVLTAVLVAFPGLALAAAGLFHPHHLTYDTSQRWYVLHLVGLPVFPLLGVALAWLVRGRADPASWLIRLAAYGYAVFYSALDVISGIAAGYVTHELGAGVPRPDEVRLLFRIGGPLGEIGSLLLIVTCLMVAVDAAVDVKGYAVGALLLLPGSYLVNLHDGHIFSPKGVIGMLLIGLGCAAVVLGRSLATGRGYPRARGATFGAVIAS